MRTDFRFYKTLYDFYMIFFCLMFLSQGTLLHDDCKHSLMESYKINQTNICDDLLRSLNIGTTCLPSR